METEEAKPRHVALQYAEAKEKLREVGVLIDRKLEEKTRLKEHVAHLTTELVKATTIPTEDQVAVYNVGKFTAVIVDTKGNVTVQKMEVVE
jgi:hypothetical protein